MLSIKNSITRDNILESVNQGKYCWVSIPLSNKVFTYSGKEDDFYMITHNNITKYVTESEWKISIDEQLK
jgi:hypothetical protein